MKMQWNTQRTKHIHLTPFNSIDWLVCSAHDIHSAAISVWTVDGCYSLTAHRNRECACNGRCASVCIHGFGKHSCANVLVRVFWRKLHWSWAEEREGSYFWTKKPGESTLTNAKEYSFSVLMATNGTMQPNSLVFTAIKTFIFLSILLSLGALHRNHVHVTEWTENEQ